MNEDPMTEMERQLRELMNIAAGEPPRGLDIELVRRGVARRRAAAYLAAAGTVVIFGGIGVALAAQPGLAPSGTGGPVQAGQPSFYVVRSFTGTEEVTTVRSTATGAVTAKVRCPSPAADVLTTIAAADHQRFFLVCEHMRQASSRDAVDSSRIYRFQVTRSGRIKGYAPVRGGLVTGKVSGIAVTPNGSEIAANFVPATAGPNVPEVIVINTGTGAHAIWRGTAKIPGKITYPVGDLSLTADGQELAFLTQPRCIRGPNAPKCKVQGGEEERVVGHAPGGGKLSSAKVLFRQSSLMRLSVGYINDAVISPDGATVTVAEVGWPEGHVSVVQISAATGKQVRILYRKFTGNGFSYRAFSSDPSGRFLLLDAGPSRGPVNGWIHNGRLIRLKPSGDNVGFEVW